MTVHHHKPHMQTRNSSPPQAPDVVPPPPEASVKAQWSEANEITFIEYIAEHKAEAGDGMKFKASFWTGAAKEMASHSALGGLKTAQGCLSKWDRVCNNLSQVTPPPMHICRQKLWKFNLKHVILVMKNGLIWMFKQENAKNADMVLNLKNSLLKIKWILD